MFIILTFTNEQRKALGGRIRGLRVSYCDFGRMISLHRFTENETDSLFNALHDLVLLMAAHEK